MTGQRWTARRGWLTMAGLAAAAAVISYLDGLSLVRAAGAVGRVVYLYPLLPDGLIVISAQSLYETARARQARPGWATGGIALGAALTVGMNVAAGAAWKVPLALVDGVVPVVFFTALEIFIGHIRRGRDAAPDMVSAPSWTDAETAAMEALARTVAAGNPLSNNQLMTQFRLSRAEASKVRRAVAWRGRDRPAPGPVPAAQAALNGDGAKGNG